jgi:glycerol-3-phosphate dehydrogenase (NAD(P)+)
MAIATIIGSGLMGSAMAWPLADNGFTVHLVGTHLDGTIIESCKKNRFHPSLKRTLPDQVVPFDFSQIDEAVKNAELIVCGVSSPGIDWIAEVLSHRIRANQLVVSITKGLRVDTSGTIEFFPDVIARQFAESIRNRVVPAAIGGPCIAGELAARRHTCVMLGSRNLETAKTIASLLQTHYYHIQPTDDLTSLEICVAMKNAFTVAVGMAYGSLTADEADMNVHNTAAALFAEGCTEIGELVRFAGGNERFSSALPGAGDLFVTSAGGRTMTLGRLLGQGFPYAEAERMLAGVTLESVQIIREMAKALAIWEADGCIGPRSFPLLRALIAVIVEGKKQSFPFNEFFRGV